MASMTAPGTQMMPPVPDQLEPALTRWPLRAALELGALPTAPGCARAWTRQIAWEWRLTSLADSAELIVSELVTNAALASRRRDRPAIWLSLVCDLEQFVIFVRDFDPGTPAPRHASEDEESGRGLMLVEAISDRFGWGRPADSVPGKVVWAVLRCELPPHLRCAVHHRDVAGRACAVVRAGRAMRWPAWLRSAPGQLSGMP